MRSYLMSNYQFLPGTKNCRIRKSKRGWGEHTFSFADERTFYQILPKWLGNLTIPIIPIIGINEKQPGNAENVGIATFEAVTMCICAFVLL